MYLRSKRILLKSCNQRRYFLNVLSLAFIQNFFPGIAIPLLMWNIVSVLY